MSPPAVICSSALTIYGCDSWFAGPANSVSPPGSSSASACQVRFFSSRSNPTHSWLLQCGPGYTGVSTSCTSASLNVCILRADCMHLLLGFALRELTRAQSETSPAPPVLHVRPVTSLRLFSSVFHHPSGLIAVRLRWLKFPVLLCYSPRFARELISAFSAHSTFDCLFPCLFMQPTRRVLERHRRARAS